ncbi:MAG: SUMF1/EgtB/PvdO family nonheme iron enzyme [Thermodesulfobacteriota bacterium]|nr:SUMF1/EgtB/PvdO family nonheme iron enzyme [Thermodesulfobacteriota bacterium]
MKKILFVSVDTLILDKISSLLREHEHASDFDVLKAESLQDCDTTFKKTKIDIVVIDLLAPSTSDLELLKTITKNNARIPFFVMTDFECRKIESTIKAIREIRYFEKPVDFTALADKMVQEMAGGVGGVFHGISLASFLQMSEMEGASCTLKVKAGKQEEGRLYLRNGALVAAATGATGGEEAVYQILDWNSPTIEIDYPDINITREINQPLMRLLMEGTRRQDVKSGKVVHKSGKVVYKPVKAGDTADTREGTEKKKAAAEKKQADVQKQRAATGKKKAATEKEKAAAGKKKAAAENGKVALEKKKATPEKAAVAAPRKIQESPPAEPAEKTGAESDTVAAADEPRATGNIIPWWKNKKIRYSIIAGIAGFVCLGLFAFFFSSVGVRSPGEDAVNPLTAGTEEAVQVKRPAEDAVKPLTSGAAEAAQGERPVEGAGNTGRFYVNTNNKNAAIILPDIKQEYSPGMLLAPGKYKVIATAPDHAPIEKTAVVSAGTDNTIDIQFPPDTGTLYVTTKPSGARIRIMNYDKEFHQGMALPPGKYRINAEKTGFARASKWVTVSANQKNSVSFSLATDTGTLYVTTKPSGARIRIMNYDKEFHQGIALPPGKYQVNAESGFARASEWVTVSANQKNSVSLSLTPAEVFTNSLGMKFKWIGPGSFTMGSPATEAGRAMDEYQRKVTISKGFYIQTTEVTQKQWRMLMGSNPSYFTGCGENCPVENISWLDAQEFIKKLKAKYNMHYDIPTEAEWEYACRAGSKTAIYTGPLRISGLNNGPELDPVAWYGGNSCADYSGADDCSGRKGAQIRCQRCGTHPVAKKKPNAWGLYDMLGNVWEWCSDWYNNFPGGYNTGPVTDPRGPSIGTHRIIRGGSWFSGAAQCRSAFHDRSTPTVPSKGVGLRVIVRK